MKQTFEEALKSADLSQLVLRLEYYASGLMMRKLWRGHRLGSGAKGQLLAAGKSADDFVSDAFEALFEGRRTYDTDFDLEKNLKRTIESLIWNWFKKSKRQPLLDHKTSFTEDGSEFDPVELASDPKTAEISDAEINERRESQRQFLAEFKLSLNTDDELLALFDALENDFTKPADIEELTGISAKRIYELKRKLPMKLSAFAANHHTAAALQK